jgi:hypothetical protein
MSVRGIYFAAPRTLDIGNHDFLGMAFTPVAQPHSRGAGRAGVTLQERHDLPVCHPWKLAEVTDCRMPTNN